MTRTAVESPPIIVMGTKIKTSEENFQNRYLRPYAQGLNTLAERRENIRSSSGTRMGDPDNRASSKSVPALNFSSVSPKDAPRRSVQDFKTKIAQLQENRNTLE
jgi:hypothetical protein